MRGRVWAHTWVKICLTLTPRICLLGTVKSHKARGVRGKGGDGSEGARCCQTPQMKTTLGLMQGLEGGH